MSETTFSVYEALRAAITDVGGVDKDGFNKHQSFAFRSIESTTATTRVALLEHQISLIPSFTLLSSTDWDRGEGKAPMHRTELSCLFKVIGPAGDSFEFSTVGEAVDYEGRTANKAMSAGTKNALLRLLQIGSGEDGDAQAQHPASTPQAGGSLAATVAGVASTVGTGAGNSGGANAQTGEIRTITEGQGKNLYRLWKIVLGWDRDRYFQEIELVAGVQVTDDRKLSFDQASAMIKSLKERAGEEDTSSGSYARDAAPDYDDTPF